MRMRERLEVIEARRKEGQVKREEKRMRWRGVERMGLIETK